MGLEYTYSIVFNTVGTICGIGALGLVITSTISNDWRNIEGVVMFGLWQSCFRSVCKDAGDEKWLQGTRGCLLVSTFLTLSAALINFISIKMQSRLAREISGVVSYLAGALTVAGTVIFSIYAPASGYSNGLGYFYALLSGGLNFVAGLFQQISSRYVK